MRSRIKVERRLRALFLAILLFAVACSYSFAQVCGLPGNDGPVTANGIVNTYYPPASAAVTVNAGATTIPLGAASTNGATTPIAVGDLVLIIQMQDATINSGNTSSYGSGTAGPGAGYTGGTVGAYEFAVAASAVSASGGTLTVSAGLINKYTAAAASGTQGEKSFQVVRVPQYSSVTLGTVRAAAWDGNTGGIVAFDVAGTMNLAGGTIDVSGRGFRGGGGLNQNGGSSGSNTDYRDVSTLGWGASKGEGIAGTPRYVFNSATNSVIDNGVEGYPNGSYMRGAPGNAGGGGNDGDPAANDENSGGGGGANGGAGGTGGNTWSSNLAYGGRGGAKFTGSATKIVMGGGGGAGTANNNGGYLNSGAAGGGIVIVRVGAVSGSGTISANGATALDIDQDGAGGGGAGGTVIVTAKTGTLSGLTINANGGAGGDTWPNNAPGTNNINAHGPGGGGGGGVVYQSGGATVNVALGVNGTSTTSKLDYGATDGTAGVSSTTTAASVPGALSGSACVPVLTVTKSTSTASVLQGSTATYTITVKNAAGVAAAQQVNISDPFPQPVTRGFTYASTGSVTLSGGATRPTTTNPNVGDATPNWGVYTIPANGQVTITFTANVAYLVPAATYQNTATATYLDPGRTTSTGTTSASYNSSSSTAEDVTVSTAISISGSVFADVNHNGSLDSGESWANGVTLYVNLVSGTTVKQFVQVTAGSGAYSFSSVIPGTYTVVLTSSTTSTTATVPSGWLATSPSTASLALTTGTSSLVGQNFGLFAGSKVSGSAFVDNGTGGGIANDGKLNGSEKSLASVPIIATNGAAITYDSATTDANGTYTLWIPNTATTVVIDETSPNGYIATGGDVGTSGGTYSRSATTITFTYSPSATYTGLRFGQVQVNTFVADNALGGAPGASVVYPHTFTALSAGQVTFSSTATSSTPNWFTQLIFKDNDCSGTLAGGDTPLTSAITVNAGDKVCIIVKDMIATAAGYDAVDAITVRADFTYTNASPTLSATYTRSDTTTVSNAANSGLRLAKTVDKTTAKSGDTLLYTITYSNVSSGTVSNIVVADSTPAYTTFVSAACGALPTGITGCNVSTQPGSGGTGSIKWTLSGSLASSASGQLTFNVRIQ